MFDLEISLADEPGALATIGEVLARADISIEGGGMFVMDGQGVGHFLVEDGATARQTLIDHGIDVRACTPVLLQRLNQDEPGQLGKLCRNMGDAGVNIQVQYSDHSGQLVLVVDDPERGRKISEQWMTNS